jgi:hypothetical protein
MVNPRHNTCQEASNDLDQQDPDPNLDYDQAHRQVLAMQTQLMQTMM